MLPFVFSGGASPSPTKYDGDYNFALKVSLCLIVRFSDGQRSPYKYGVATFAQKERRTLNGVLLSFAYIIFLTLLIHFSLTLLILASIALSFGVL